MNKLKLISAFMISLVLTLPFIFADQLSVQRFSGADNIDGFARDEDIKRALDFGCTRMEIGVQILDDKIYKKS